MAGIVCLINVIAVSYIFLLRSPRKLGHKPHKRVVFSSVVEVVLFMNFMTALLLGRLLRILSHHPRKKNCQRFLLSQHKVWIIHKAKKM